MTEDIQDFLSSYSNTIQNMDLFAVKPFTETEVQPVYSDIWVKYLKEFCVKCFGYNTDFSKLFLNPSSVRSMLIMDLFDCYFTNNKDLAHDVFLRYSTILDKLYKYDKFSCYSNLPHSSINTNYLKDLEFFNSNNFFIKELLKECFLYSYGTFQDIYAGNCYEILGPYYTRNNVCVVYFFRNIAHLGTIQIVGFCPKYNVSKMYGSGVDMFGHTLFTPLEYCVVYENKVIENFKIKELKNTILNLNKRISEFTSRRSKTDLICLNLKNRIMCYEKLYEKLNIQIDYDLLYNRIVSKPLKKRILSTNTLIEIMKKNLL